MNVYEKAVRTVEEYLSQLAEMDATEHLHKGQYRVVINNWEGCCESTVIISVNPETDRVTYKMYYNGARVVTDEQRTILTEYFSRVDKRTIRERCTGGIDENGAIFIQAEHSCILYGLRCEDLQVMQNTCTQRISSDRYHIMKFING